MMTAAGISNMQATAAKLWFHPLIYIIKIRQFLKDLFPVGRLRNNKKFMQTQMVTGSQKAV
jgi:hypothetical protein